MVSAADDRAAEQWEVERRHLESELRELRSQLGKSAAMVSEYSELRRELDKSEKQRTQLSDHIQVSITLHGVRVLRAEEGAGQE